jgi:hypothetical protein
VKHSTPMYLKSLPRSLPDSGLTGMGFSRRSRVFPSWEGQGVGTRELEQHARFEPTPTPSQEGNKLTLQIAKFRRD